MLRRFLWCLLVAVYPLWVCISMPISPITFILFGKSWHDITNWRDFSDSLLERDGG